MHAVNGGKLEKAGAAAAPRDDARAILEALDRIERRLDRVEAMAQRAEHEGRAAIAIVTDTFDRTVSGLRAEGVDLDARVRNALRAAERLSSDEALATLDATFAHTESIRTVLGSGILDPSAVAIVAQAGRALAEAAAEPAESVGAFGLVRAMGEADVRSAAGLLVRFARRLGRSLSTTSARRLAADNVTGATEGSRT